MRKWRLLLVLALVGILGFIAFTYFTGFQNLTINVSSDMDSPAITVYKVPSEKDVSNPQLALDDKNIVKKLTGDETLKLRKGRYYVTATSKTTADYALDVTLQKEAETITISPNLNASVLAERIKTEEPAILAVLMKSYPQINNGYVLQTGKLYAQGDWYSTTLVSGSNPNPNDYHDIYHVVLHKEDGTWKVKTKFPELNVDKFTYPDIPKDILSEADRQGINF